MNVDFGLLQSKNRPCASYVNTSHVHTSSSPFICEVTAIGVLPRTRLLISLSPELGSHIQWSLSQFCRTNSSPVLHDKSMPAVFGVTSQFGVHRGKRGPEPAKQRWRQDGFLSLLGFNRDSLAGATKTSTVQRLPRSRALKTETTNRRLGARVTRVVYKAATPA